MEKKKKKVGRPRNKETDTIVSKIGVSKRTAERMVKRGINLDNIDTYDGARLAKVQVEIRVLEEKLSIMQKLHVPATQVREDALAAFAILRAEVGAQEVRLPPLLEGLTAKEMRTVLAGHSERMLKDLSERLEAIA